MDPTLTLKQRKDHTSPLQHTQTNGHHLKWMTLLSLPTLMNNLSPANIFYSQMTPFFCIYIFQTMYQRCLQPIRSTHSKKQLQVPTNLVVDNNNKLQVTVHDILSLANYTYFNDVIINYILDNHHTETNRSDIYLLDSLFFSSPTHKHK